MGSKRKKNGQLRRILPLRYILILLVGLSIYQYYTAGEVSWLSNTFQSITQTTRSFADNSSSVNRTPETVNAQRPTEDNDRDIPAIDLSGRVVRVADGDTITILDSSKTQHKIRFHGIDTPERGQPYGNAAREALANMVAGKTVGIVVIDTDRYGRTVGKVYVNGRDVNLALVEQGFAWWYRRYAPKDRALEAAERSARERKLGLWKETDPIPPWEWRKEKSNQ